MDTPIEYIGESLWFGQVGALFVISAFVFSLIASVSYFLSFRSKEQADRWLSLGRISFYITGMSVLGIVAILFYLLYNHYFEYHYVWEHSSLALPVRYLIACFWEGQEGSFLLWAFWHIVLAFFIIKRSGNWEAPVMSVISIVQVFLFSMLLGAYFFGIKIGSTPFGLLREHPDMANLPFIQMPDYLARILDGRGLNPLLQNYWMVIHPPVLFLGFASTLIPFAFAIAALLTGRVTEWIKPAIPWTLFSIAALGTGVLMGAAWAYEALSFGGFWAWDPVENASLVPWLIIVGAAHVLLIYKHQGRTLLSSFILNIAAFLLVLYSTFLTRSGILGDASVHAFTDLGMSGQLLVYMGFFVVLSVYLLIRHRKKIQVSLNEEENLSSREFWMFIGMLVLVISSFQITLTTSLPVINKILGSKFAPPADAIAHFNAWQLPIAAILTLLIAVGQFFKWKESNVQEVLKKLLLSFIASILLTSLSAYSLALTTPHYIVFLFTGIFAFTANVDYLFRTLKGKMKISGSSLAHAGFALLMVGVLISNSKSRVISQTHSAMDFGEGLPANQNVMLMKGDTVMMGDYFVTYKGKKKEGVNIYYEVEYYKYNFEKNKLEKEFTLNPIIQTNPRMGNVSEPDTKHFFEKDIYTHITYAELKDKNPDSIFNAPAIYSLSIGDTVASSGSIVVFSGIEKNFDKSKLSLDPNDFVIGANIEVTDRRMKKHVAMPLFIIRNNFIYSRDVILEEPGLKFAFTKVDPESGKFDIEVSERKAEEQEFVIMKAIVFPWINIVWTGSILMVIGTLIAVRKRILKNRVA